LALVLYFCSSFFYELFSAWFTLLVVLIGQCNLELQEYGGEYSPHTTGGITTNSSTEFLRRAAQVLERLLNARAELSWDALELRDLG